MKKYYYVLMLNDYTEQKAIPKEKAKEIFESKCFEKFRETKTIEYIDKITNIYDFKHKDTKATLLLFEDIEKIRS